jgi:hypothetical protein
MTLVGADGSFTGEGVMARQAQAAWTLYRLTGDAAPLRKTYPAMKRMLLWKANNPRWMYIHSPTPPASKDVVFVVNALLDMDAARKIAAALGMTDEVSFWDRRIQDDYAHYREWFWDTPGGSPRVGYNTEAKGGYSYNHPWCLQGLALPPDILQAPERDSLLKLMRTLMDPKVPLLFKGATSQPAYNLILRGAWQYGTPEEAVRIAEAAMRDVTLAGELTENYTQDGFPPEGGGVKPNASGGLSLVDAVLLRNGVILDQGLPVLAHLPGARGVENIRLKDGPISIHYDAEGDGVSVEGPGLKDLALPAGFQAEKSAGEAEQWHGTLAVGRSLALEPAG